MSFSALILLLYIFVALFTLAPKLSSNKIVYASLYVLMLLLAILRPENAVNDYKSYLLLYKYISFLSTLEVEQSFLLVAKFVKSTFNNPIFLFAIYAILGVGLKLLAIKRLSEFWILSLLIYIANFYLLHEMTQIRVGVAAGFMLLAAIPAYERKTARFLTYAFLAFFFHYSAILVFLIWFLPTKNINRILYLVALPAAYLLYMLGISIASIAELIPIEVLQHKIASYKALMALKQTPINVFNIVQLLRCAFVLLFLWKLPILKQKNQYSPILLQCYIWGVILLVVLSDLPVLAFRISDLLCVTEIILIPYLCSVAKPKAIAELATIIIGLCILTLNLYYVKLIIA